MSFRLLNKEQTWVSVTQDITKLPTDVDLMNWEGLSLQCTFFFSQVWTHISKMFVKLISNLSLISVSSIVAYKF